MVRFSGLAIDGHALEPVAVLADEDELPLGGLEGVGQTAEAKAVAPGEGEPGAGIEPIELEAAIRRGFRGRRPRAVTTVEHPGAGDRLAVGAHDLSRHVCRDLDQRDRAEVVNLARRCLSMSGVSALAKALDSIETL